MSAIPTRLARILALGLVGTLLLAGLASSASWSQSGHDAARTGALPEQGPLVDDIAFQVTLPGRFDFPDTISNPLIHEGYAYVAVESMTWWNESIALDGVVRVNLDTTEMETVVELEDDRARTIAIDDEHLYVVTDRTLQAYRTSDFERVWTWTHPDLFPEQTNTDTEACDPPALQGSAIYLACTQGGFDPPPRLAGFVARVDAENGQEDWLWTTQHTSSEAAGSGQAGANEPAPALVLGVSVVGSEVLAPVASFVPFEARDDTPCDLGVPCSELPGTPGWDAVVVVANMSLVAIDQESGLEQWRHSTSEEWGQVDAAGQRQTVSELFAGGSGHPTGSAEAVYVQLDEEVLALNPRNDGGVLWREQVGELDRSQENVALTSIVHRGQTVYVTSSQTIYRFDTGTQATNLWRTVLDPGLVERFTYSELILAGDTLYVGAELPGDQGTMLYAVDGQTGGIVWRHHVPVSAPFEGWGVHHYHAVGEGVLVVAGGDTSLRVIGRTNASLVPRAEPSTVFPAPGEPVSVDLAGTGPGAFGEATRYRAIWGDGTETGWQNSSVLTHTYEQAGDVEARLIAGNEANQTASTVVTFQVGTPAPTEPNLIETAFAQENQEVTFGVLGILVAVTGGAVGVARRYRERSRLQDELDAIEELYEQTREHPVECEAQLTERKAHGRGLLADGDLTEAQFGVVEGRIEELKRELRMDAVDEEFAFLPYSLVTALREMLDDGRVSAMEKDGFLAALEADELVHPDQKAVVRRRIEDWFARDAGSRTS